MDGGTITLKEVMRQIRSGEPFSIAFVTCDRKRKTGGDIIQMPACVCTRVSGEGKEQAPAKDANIVKPNHQENATLNIMAISSRQVRKVHPRLITAFNGKKVYY